MRQLPSLRTSIFIFFLALALTFSLKGVMTVLGVGTPQAAIEKTHNYSIEQPIYASASEREKIAEFWLQTLLFLLFVVVISMGIYTIQLKREISFVVHKIEPSPRKRLIATQRVAVKKAAVKKPRVKKA